MSDIRDEVALPATDRTTSGQRRIGALTGLRWWAAFGVLLSHNAPRGDTPPLLTAVFDNGNLGVTIFFVLSGFILTVTYRDAMMRPTFSGVWDFAVARFARVYPLYLLVLLWVTPRKMFTIGLPLDETWLAHLFAAQSWLGVPRVYDWNGPGWSIGVEFFFYACFPFVMVAARPLLRTARGAAVLVVIGIAAVVAVAAVVEPAGWTSAGQATLLPPLRLCDFVLGIGIGALYLRRTGSRPLFTAGVVLIGFWLAWTLAFIWLRSFYYALPGINVLYAIPSAALILGLAWTPSFIFTRSLSTRPMIVLGEASFAFYLVHLSVGAPLTGAGLLSAGLTPSGVALFTLGTVFVIALSIGLNIMIEAPARRAVRWLMSPSSRRRPTAGSGSQART